MNISDMRVWPNLVLTELNIQLTKFSGPVKVNIINALGKKLYENEFGTSDILIQPGISSGVYYLEVITGSTKRLIKIVK